MEITCDDANTETEREGAYVSQMCKRIRDGQQQADGTCGMSKVGITIAWTCCI